MRVFFILLLLSSALIARPVVLVSVPPQKFIVEKVAGKSVDVSLIVPAGASPHSYEPTAKQVNSLASASIWFCIGEDFETRLLSALSVRVFDQREGVDLLRACCCHDGADPHLWLSPSIVRSMATQVCSVLSEELPEKRVFFEENLAVFLRDLERVEQKLSERVFPSAILVSHPAFGYFCRDFGIEQLSIEMEGQEPGPRQVTDLVLRVRALGLHSVFLQKQYSLKGGLTIARELGLKRVFVDPYAENVLQNLSYLGEVFSD
ncbi:MAG: zinc ABC transporter substrate-binding protein [Chlamydiales bacterium]|nr:zinc ABC transporter substrate-binding protein [Chlamydiales bacterium]